MRFFTAGSKPAKQWSRSVDNRDSTAQIQDCSEGLSFLRFLCETEISLQSGAHFAGLIFQKCSAHLNLWELEVQTELSLQSGALFVDNFARSRRKTAETEILLRRPQEPLYPNKNTGFGAREHFHPWVHTLPNFYASLLLDDGWLTDDVVDMMVGMLTMTNRLQYF
jgi:hypothetical protein